MSHRFVETRTTISLLLGLAVLGLSGCAATQSVPRQSPMITVVGSPEDVDAFVRVVDIRRQLPVFRRILESMDPAPVFIVGSGAMVHQYLPVDRRLECSAFPGDLFLAPGVQYVDLEDLNAFPQWTELGVTVPEWAITHDTVLAHIIAEGSHSATTQANFEISHRIGIEAENELRSAHGQEGRILFREITMDGSRSGHPVLETGILNEQGGIWIERVHSDGTGSIRTIDYFEDGLIVATRTIGDSPPALSQHPTP